jgi:hypothetical protein
VPERDPRAEALHRLQDRLADVREEAINRLPPMPETIVR